MIERANEVALVFGWIVLGLGGTALMIALAGLTMDYGWRTLRNAVRKNAND